MVALNRSTDLGDSSWIEINIHVVNHSSTSDSQFAQSCLLSIELAKRIEERLASFAAEEIIVQACNVQVMIVVNSSEVPIERSTLNSEQTKRQLRDEGLYRLTYSEIIRKYREWCGFTQEGLALKVGIASRKLWSYENTTDIPDHPTATQLEEVLRIPKGLLVNACGRARGLLGHRLTP